MLAHSIRCARRGKIDPKIDARKTLDVCQLTFGFDKTVNNADEEPARSNRVTDGSIATAGVPAIDAFIAVADAAHQIRAFGDIGPAREEICKI